MWEWLKKWWGKADDGLGGRGENLAARFLRDKGYKIIDRNYRSPVGEIDIIARDGDTLVFVEVKTREDEEPMPEEQVNSIKQRQITKAAQAFLSRYSTSPPPARFDVVAVVWPRGRDAQIRHTENAFEAN